MHSLMTNGCGDITVPQHILSCAGEGTNTPMRMHQSVGPHAPLPVLHTMGGE